MINSERFRFNFKRKNHNMAPVWSLKFETMIFKIKSMAFAVLTNRRKNQLVSQMLPPRMLNLLTTTTSFGYFNFNFCLKKKKKNIFWRNFFFLKLETNFLHPNDITLKNHRTFLITVSILVLMCNCKFDRLNFLEVRRMKDFLGLHS